MAEYRFPIYDLESSLEVARRITARGAGATLTGHELAAFLGYTGTANGAYLNRMASARLFGLIEGQASAIGATDRAVRILHPDYPETAERARLEAFRAVPLFGAFLEAFRGRPLPDEGGIINTLTTRFSVPPRDAKMAMARLLSSAEQAGLFSTAGPGRMIEPTIREGSEPAPQSEGEEPEEPIKRAGTTTLYGSALMAGVRSFPKIIEGALDLMPSGPPWDEAEYRDWLDFFDKACRVYYRIKRSPSGTE
jgi:hypothetical protein